MHYVAASLYPPLTLGLQWPLFGIGFFVVVVGGYFGVRWVRLRLALRGQQKLVELQKPHKDQIIARALQEINRIRQAVESGTLPPETGAAQVSLVARTAFDTLMNHRTVYQAKYEIAIRRLDTMVAMLETSYPVAFDPPRDKSTFSQICDAAIKVVESCR